MTPTNNKECCSQCNNWTASTTIMACINEDCFCHPSPQKPVEKCGVKTKVATRFQDEPIRITEVVCPFNLPCELHSPQPEKEKCAKCKVVNDIYCPCRYPLPAVSEWEEKLRFAAYNIVVQLDDDSGASVDFRQANNDRRQKFVKEIISELLLSSHASLIRELKEKIKEIAEDWSEADQTVAFGMRDDFLSTLNNEK